MKLYLLIGLSSVFASAVAIGAPSFTPALEKIRAEIGLQVGEYESHSGPRCGGGLVTLREAEGDVLLTVGATPVVFTGLNGTGPGNSKVLTEKSDGCASETKTERARGQITMRTTRTCEGKTEVETATLTIRGGTLKFSKSVARGASTKCEWRQSKVGAT